MGDEHMLLQESLRRLYLGPSTTSATPAPTGTNAPITATGQHLQAHYHHLHQQEEHGGEDRGGGGAGSLGQLGGSLFSEDLFRQAKHRNLHPPLSSASTGPSCTGLLVNLHHPHQASSPVLEHPQRCHRLQTHLHNGPVTAGGPDARLCPQGAGGGGGKGEAFLHLDPPGPLPPSVSVLTHPTSSSAAQCLVSSSGATASSLSVLHDIFTPPSPAAASPPPPPPPPPLSSASLLRHTLHQAQMAPTSVNHVFVSPGPRSGVEEGGMSLDRGMARPSSAGPSPSKTPTPRKKKSPKEGPKPADRKQAPSLSDEERSMILGRNGLCVEVMSRSPNHRRRSLHQQSSPPPAPQRHADVSHLDTSRQRSPATGKDTPDTLPTQACLYSPPFDTRHDETHNSVHLLRGSSTSLVPAPQPPPPTSLLASSPSPSSCSAQASFLSSGAGGGDGVGRRGLDVAATLSPGTQHQQHQQGERKTVLQSVPGNQSPSTHNAGEGARARYDGGECFSSSSSSSDNLKSSRDACVLVTLPLSLPYGKIVNLVSATGGTEADSCPSPHPTRGGGGGGGAPKRNYYCFNPRTHPAARKLFSPVAGICDTYAAALHVELAIIHVPETLLPEVANMFLEHSNRPRTHHRLCFKTPLSFKCGHLQERPAPCRAGGKVLTLECIFDNPEEQRKLHAIEQFLMGFRTDLENLLASYKSKRAAYAGGRKPNIWRLSQVVTPGWGAHSGSQSRNPRLDVTVRAFEQQDRGGLLNLSSRVQSEHDCVADVQASEIRLVTTRSYGRLTNKVDPRFKNAKLNTRCLLLSRPLSGHPSICRKEFAPQVTAEVVPVVLDPKAQISFDELVIELEREVVYRMEQGTVSRQRGGATNVAKTNMQQLLWKLDQSQLKAGGGGEFHSSDVSTRLSPAVLSPGASPLLVSSVSSRHAAGPGSSTPFPLLAWSVLSDPTMRPSPSTSSNTNMSNTGGASSYLLPAWSPGNTEGVCLAGSPSSDICSTRDSGGILSSPGSQGDGTPESRMDDTAMRSPLGELLKTKGSSIRDSRPGEMQIVPYDDAWILGTNGLTVSNGPKEEEEDADDEADPTADTTRESNLWKRGRAAWPSGLAPSLQFQRQVLEEGFLPCNGNPQLSEANFISQDIWSLVRDFVHGDGPRQTEHRVGQNTVGGVGNGIQARGGPHSETGEALLSQQQSTRNVLFGISGGLQQNAQQHAAPGWENERWLRDDFMRPSSQGPLDSAGFCSLEAGQRRDMSQAGGAGNRGRDNVFQSTSPMVAEQAEKMFLSPQAALHDLLASVVSKCPGTQSQGSSI